MARTRVGLCEQSEGYSVQMLSVLVSKSIGLDDLNMHSWTTLGTFEPLRGETAESSVKRGQVARWRGDREVRTELPGARTAHTTHHDAYAHQ
jgi:effector-binding domain-containing protein